MHPDISEAAIVGVPDPVWGEVGIAVCVDVAVRRSARRL